jgi:tRNA (adenine57-N1/adenine58-N1)-methyltransferase catalytic subunit
VERREDHAAHGRKSIERWFGEVPAHSSCGSGEVEERVADVAPDRLVLDLPEPWHAARVAAESQPPGGVFCAYLPTVPQVQTLVEASTSRAGFAEVEVFETLHRTWNIAGRSVRPDHEMVGTPASWWWPGE